MKEKLITTITELKANHKDKWAVVKPKSLPESVLPSQIDVVEVVKENRRLNYLYSLETSLQRRALENQQYEKRVKVAESKWGNAEKKLEKVRDLVSSGQIMKVMELVKQGKI